MTTFFIVNKFVITGFNCTSTHITDSLLFELLLLTSGIRNFSSIVLGALIILLLTREGPSVGSSCQHMDLFSSALHNALEERETGSKRLQAKLLAEAPNINFITDHTPHSIPWVSVGVDYLSPLPQDILLFRTRGGNLV